MIESLEISHDNFTYFHRFSDRSLWNLKNLSVDSFGPSFIISTGFLHLLSLIFPRRRNGIMRLVQIMHVGNLQDFISFQIKFICTAKCDI